MTTDHASLVPSFRDFSHYFKGHSIEELIESAKSAPEPELPKPTVLEVEHILKHSPAGKLGEAISFDGWPWLERMGFLDAVIPGLKVHSLGGIAPFQADGIWGPYEWYYRERGGYASLRLAPIATFPGAQEALYSAKGEVAEFSGPEGWVPRFLKLWEKLERSPFLYEFPAREVNYEKTEGGLELVLTGEDILQPGWGYSPTDAWLNTAQYSAYYEEYFGWTKELQEKRRELMEISKEPANRDERVYPLEDPDFTVNWDALAAPDELQRFLEVEADSADS